MRVRAATECEEVISDLIDRHMRVADHAVTLFGSLRQQMNDGRAERTAVRRAGVFFHLSRGSIAQDSTPLMSRPAPGVQPRRDAQRTGRPGPGGRAEAWPGNSRLRPVPPARLAPIRWPAEQARADRTSPLPARAAIPDPQPS